MTPQFCQYDAANVCRYCGYQDDAVPMRNCPEAGGATTAVSQAAASPRAKLLGDRLEQAFSRVGITKERYVEAKAALGLPPTCGCQRRQDWLNKAHAWWAEKLSGSQESRDPLPTA